MVLLLYGLGGSELLLGGVLGGYLLVSAVLFPVYRKRSKNLQKKVDELTNRLIDNQK